MLNNKSSNTFLYIASTILASITVIMFLISLLAEQSFNPKIEYNMVTCKDNCEFTNKEKQKIKLSISKIINLANMQKIYIELKLDNLSAKVVSLDIDCQDQYMQHNFLTLNKKVDNLFIGTTMIPAHTNQLVIRATLESDQKDLIVPFTYRLK